MSIIPCLSWIPIMLEQIRGLFVRNNNTVEVDLPYEIIADILSRLPAETVILCLNKCKPLFDLVSTPSFIDLHLNRARAASPIIAFHYRLPKASHDKREGDKYTEVVNVCFTPQKKSNNYVVRSSPIDVCADHCVYKCCASVLYGSCNGLLLFKSSDCQSLLSIWNPVTGERNTLIPTPKSWCRGFFFHPKDQEYKVVFLTLALKFSSNCFEYYIYGWKTKTFRLIQSYSYPPIGDRNPILLNGVLHWKVHHVLHKNVKGVYPSCSNSILLFDIYTEKFSTMSHPGGECGQGDHNRMQLMENEGHLYLCNPSSSDDIVIWRLEDYENKAWVKIHVIRQPNKVLLRSGMLLPLDMHNDQIIIRGGIKHIFLYNMSFCNFKRIGRQFTDLSILVYPFYHVDSLVSLEKSTSEV